VPRDELLDNKLCVACRRWPQLLLAVLVLPSRQAVCSCAHRTPTYPPLGVRAPTAWPPLRSIPLHLCADSSVETKSCSFTSESCCRCRCQCSPQLQSAHGCTRRGNCALPRLTLTHPAHAHFASCSAAIKAPHPSLHLVCPRHHPDVLSSESLSRSPIFLLPLPPWIALLTVPLSSCVGLSRALGLHAARGPIGPTVGPPTSPHR
jgi:hypothetical protein